MGGPLTQGERRQKINNNNSARRGGARDDDAAASAVACLYHTARHGRNGNLWIYLVVRANGARRFPLPDDGDGTECLP